MLDSGSRFVLTGRVQGLGVRPTIHRLATELGLAGTVGNTPRGVEIEIEGSQEQLAEFTRRLPNELPPGTSVVSFDQEPIEPRGRDSFRIVAEPTDGPLTVQVPPDRATCAECLAEVQHAQDRRYRYPLTSCTACGPRYTIIRDLPYERTDTTMSEFSLCSPCRTEYEDAANRRFHAQTNACWDCGPQVWSVERHHRAVERGDNAMRVAARAIRTGQIVALRGLGGYQLLVDATDEDAVRRLRERKRRLAKPLAVMAASLDLARQLAQVDADEAQALTDASNPIVLLLARGESGLASSIHPGLNVVGVMLPTTPLHDTLARDVGRPLVCTSGNLDGNPLEFEVTEAEQNLEGVCDVWLHHDRPIARPVDDSVVRVIGGRRVTIRLARGLAPLPLSIPSLRPTLALGGHLKSALAWCNGVQSVLGPHVGDLEGLGTRQRFLSECTEAQHLYRFQPQQLVHDAHPDYFTTRWASTNGSSLIAVQHHHAHILAGMLEHGWLDRPVLGVAWDGTGYAADGTIWGGEFLFVERTRCQRIAHLRPFCLPGGEAAIHQPWRVALAMAAEVDMPSTTFSWLEEVDEAKRQAVDQIRDRPQFSPRTTSAGRLFDAAASIALGVHHADFDGQPAMFLEAVADEDAGGQYELPLQRNGCWELDWRPLVAGLLADRAAGVDPGAMSIRFHRALAAGIAAVCRRHPDLPVVLSGGVFQNRLLTDLVLAEFSGEDRLGLPGEIPPNDGGLAAGQLAYAALMEEAH